MWIIGNSSGRRTISRGCEVIVERCSFPASEQLSGNHSSLSWTVGTGYPRWLWRYQEYSFPRLFVPWNILSHDGTFVQ